MSPDVSLIIPVFNNEALLDSSLASAREQTGVSLEIIVIDDGSTDSSLSLIRAHAAADPRIIVISQANQGVSAARNAGLDRAIGRWVAFLDGDDWLAPGSLAEWLQQAEKAELDCLICNAFCFKTESNPQAMFDARPPGIITRQPWESIMSGAEWIVQSVKVREWPHYVWLQFCRRSVLEEARLRFRRDMIHEDIPWTIELALAARRLGFSPAPRYGYRRNPSSLTQSRNPDRVRHRIASYLRVAELLQTLSGGRPASLCKALHKQVLREMGHFLGLMRKGNVSRADRSRFASEFLAAGLAGAMFKSCSNYREIAAVIKAWYLCHIWRRQRS